ncbi:efflux RND transporter periplasmic adaptor subunit [Denitromonas sp.]|uniref:efflux RND transporter periplasmic adaptor subunit n=1 Tax=Denitromonas sp. TaxID=2734609 RepID=UPI002B001AB5|nr:efflux RND transporter periplasmic adaptor subunit [Denitromonas sp.]
MNPAALRRWAWLPLAIALLAGFAYVVARSGPLAPVRVTVATVTEGQVAPELFGIGTVDARRAYAVGPTAPGRLLQVDVDVGDTVRAGQVLARLDPVDLDARIAALDASAGRARSALAAAQAQQRDVNARAEVAAINARRYISLGRQQFVSASAVDARTQEHRSARAAVDAAAASADSAQNDLHRLQAERQALVEQRKALTLLAPVDGVVTAREAEPGTTLVAGQAALRLIDPASLWVRTRIDQGRSQGLQVGLPAQIVLRSRPAEALAGRVERVELISDAVTEERLAQIAFAALPTGISVGEMAEVTVQLPPTANGPVLPNAALQQRDGQTGVWRLDGDRLRFAPVRTGAGSPDGLVQILDGLAIGDRVVVHSEGTLTPDATITIVDSLSAVRQ